MKVLARSPGQYPILIVETPDGDLLATHFETGYALGRGKPVERSWVRENAIGRHSFIGVEPPEEVAVSELGNYATEARF
ncbi:MAG: hypothetical protein ACRDSJ_08340 [Rubrobacteraceae bacterium]